MLTVSSSMSVRTATVHQRTIFCGKTKDIFDRDRAVPESSLDKPADLNPIGSTPALQVTGRPATFAKENANLSENLGRNEGNRIEV
jgi:hypothetical protein